jgi:hypothetical protein
MQDGGTVGRTERLEALYNANLLQVGLTLGGGRLGQVGVHLDTRHDLAIRVKRGLLVERKPLHGGVSTAGECHEGTEHHHGPTPT